MSKTTTIIVLSAFGMLAASAIVATFALLFHPNNSETARIVNELLPKVECTLCSENLLQGEQCDKCDKPAMQRQDDCELTPERRKNIDDIVASVIRGNDETWINTTLHRAYAKDKGHRSRRKRELPSSVMGWIEYLNLNVPRPSAHWYLSKNPSTRKNSQEYRYVSHWNHETGHEVAHTQNGMKMHHGQMKIPRDGWYHIYIQMEVKNNSDQQFVLSVKIPGGRNIIEIQRKASSSQSPKNSSFIVKKSGIFNLLEGDCLSVQVRMSDHGKLEMDMSRTYFGAYYVRHFERNANLNLL